MSISDNETLYFDRIARTKKLQTITAFAYATINSKDKNELKKNLGIFLDIFREGGKGTYASDQSKISKQFSSQYTPGLEFGIWKNSQLELSSLAADMVSGKITPRYYFANIFLNYHQIINDKVIHPLYETLTFMENNRLNKLKKEDINKIINFNLGENERDNKNMWFSILSDTIFFNKTDDHTLIWNNELGYKLNFIKNCNISLTNHDVNEVRTIYSKQEEYTKFITQENNYLKSLFNLNNHKKIINNSLVGKPLNRILYGAPGTGKSYKLEQDRKQIFGVNYERVTFHPNYSYGQFVGTYKPRPLSDNKEKITYDFVEGPFMRILVKALSASINNDNAENFVLIIEEINRANTTAVFGDIFQLLDRNIEGKSEYTINASEDMKKYLKDNGIELDEIYIPSNLYLWSTMNSADQGVYPIDTAFKRRFDFEFININENDNKIQGIEVEINGIGKVEWNEFRTKLNNQLSNKGVKEDKLIGPFFIKVSDLKSQEKFEIAFKNKLLMYLSEDICKHNKEILFNKELNTFSKIIETYKDENSTDNIFNFKMINEEE